MDEIIRRLEKIENKLDSKLEEQSGKLHSIDITLTRQEGQLAEHMRRTEVAEENLATIRDEFKPIQKHVELMNAASKIFTGTTIVFGLVYTILEIYKHIKG